MMRKTLQICTIPHLSQCFAEKLHTTLYQPSVGSHTVSPADTDLWVWFHLRIERWKPLVIPIDPPPQKLHPILHSLLLIVDDSYLVPQMGSAPLLAVYSRATEVSFA